MLAPVLKTSLTINNLIPDSLLQINPDSSLKLVYESDFYNLTMANMVVIPDTTIDTVYYSPLIISLSPGTYFVPPVNQQQNFNVPNGVQLNQMVVKSGKMMVLARNRVDEVIRVRYQIPSASLWGVPFDKTFDKIGRAHV